MNNKLIIQDGFALMNVLFLMLMTVFPSPLWFYAIIAISLMFIRNPIVIFPTCFVASLSNTYFGLSQFFASSSGMSVGRFLSPILIISILISLLSNSKRNILNNNITILTFLFIVYCFFSCCISITGSFSPFIVIIQSLLILLFLPGLNDIDLNRLMRLMWTSSLLVVLGIWLYVIRDGIEMLLYDRFTRNDEVNSNRIAMICVQVGSALIVPFIIGKNKFLKIGSIVGYLLALVLTFFTGSRTGLISIIFAPVIVFMVLPQTGRFSSKKTKNRNIILLVLFALVVFFIFTKLGEYDSKVLSRYSFQEVEESGGSGRMGAIEVMLNEIFPMYPVFGVGLSGENFVAVSIKYGITHPCHNIFLDSLCQLGIVGFLLFISLITLIIRKSVSSLREAGNMLMVMPLILFVASVLNGIGETIYLEKFFWNNLALCVLFNINYNKQINGTI